jgi:hypothetical protein
MLVQQIPASHSLGADFKAAIKVRCNIVFIGDVHINQSQIVRTENVQETIGFPHQWRPIPRRKGLRTDPDSLCRDRMGGIIRTVAIFFGKIILLVAGLAAAVVLLVCLYTVAQELPHP